MNENEMTVFDGGGMVSRLGAQSQKNMYVSFSPDTPEQKIALYNAMNNPDEQVGNMINEKITIRDVFVEEVDMLNEETGEITAAPRIVLIDVKGKSYAAMSTGIFSSIEKLMQVFGPPTWENGLTVIVRQKMTKERRIYTLEVAQ